VKQYSRARQATGNVAHALCMLDGYGYSHTFRISNTYCFSTTTVVTRMRLIVTLYVYWLFFLPQFSFIADTDWLQQSSVVFGCVLLNVLCCMATCVCELAMSIHRYRNLHTKYV
jgi:hypothetical protein